ncbi:MAG TPA: hypothetical protein VE573_07945 [Nitrososphaeraceae archaeon]|nr:hypothetical protein [Nitrososphaeraceae archaeon]
MAFHKYNSIQYIYNMVGKSRGNKQVDKNAAKEKSTDSKRSKKLAKARRNLGGGQARGKSTTRG